MRTPSVNHLLYLSLGLLAISIARQSYGQTYPSPTPIPQVSASLKPINPVPVPPKPVNPVPAPPKPVNPVPASPKPIKKPTPVTPKPVPSTPMIPTGPAPTPIAPQPVSSSTPGDPYFRGLIFNAQSVWDLPFTSFLGSTTPIPKAVDLSSKVSLPDDQLQCGSCWVFSATKALRSEYMLAGKDPGPLEYNYLLNNCGIGPSKGSCKGGDTFLVAQSFLYSTGPGLNCIDPYLGNQTHACPILQVQAAIQSFSMLGYGNNQPTATPEPPQPIQQVPFYPPAVVSSGPTFKDIAYTIGVLNHVVIVVVDSTSNNWANYPGGLGVPGGGSGAPGAQIAPASGKIFDSCASNPTIDHSVDAIGYNCETSVDSTGQNCLFDSAGRPYNGDGYLIISNQWGEGWGIQAGNGHGGYMFTRMYASDGVTYCNGIASFAMYLDIGQLPFQPSPPVQTCNYLNDAEKGERSIADLAHLALGMLRLRVQTWPKLIAERLGSFFGISRSQPTRPTTPGTDQPRNSTTETDSGKTSDSSSENHSTQINSDDPPESASRPETDSPELRAIERNSERNSQEPSEQTARNQATNEGSNHTERTPIEDFGIPPGQETGREPNAVEPGHPATAEDHISGASPDIHLQALVKPGLLAKGLVCTMAVMLDALAGQRAYDITQVISSRKNSCNSIRQLSSSGVGSLLLPSSIPSADPSADPLTPMNPPSTGSTINGSGFTSNSVTSRVGGTADGSETSSDLGSSSSKMGSPPPQLASLDSAFTCQGSQSGCTSFGGMSTSAASAIEGPLINSSPIKQIMNNAAAEPSAIAEIALNQGPGAALQLFIPKNLNDSSLAFIQIANDAKTDSPRVLGRSPAEASSRKKDDVAESGQLSQGPLQANFKEQLFSPVWSGPEKFNTSRSNLKPAQSDIFHSRTKLSLFQIVSQKISQVAVRVRRRP